MVYTSLKHIEYFSKSSYKSKFEKQVLEKSILQVLIWLKIWAYPY